MRLRCFFDGRSPVLEHSRRINWRVVNFHTRACYRPAYCETCAVWIRDLCNSFTVCCIYFSDKLGPAGRWLRHRLLSSILIGTPPLVALQVSYDLFCCRQIGCFLYFHGFIGYFIFSFFYFLNFVIVFFAGTDTIWVHEAFLIWFFVIIRFFLCDCVEIQSIRSFMKIRTCDMTLDK